MKKQLPPLTADEQAAQLAGFDAAFVPEPSIVNLPISADPAAGSPEVFITPNALKQLKALTKNGFIKASVLSK